MRALTRIRVSSPLLAGLLLGGVALFALAPEANAQLTGTASKPLPNVMLLVDTSGSMERLSDNSITGADAACGGTFVPNRWHMLVQALTGNVQNPSCVNVNRAANSNFDKEFRINGKSPKDVGYALNWHRLLSGSGSNACVVAPYAMPGGFVGPGSGRQTGLLSEAFPNDVFMQANYNNLQSSMTSGSPYTPAKLDECLFSQASDGQLDNVRDFIRLGLMTFDSDTDGGIGVSNPAPPGGLASTTPFDGEWSYIGAAGAKSGRPVGCTTPGGLNFEVGARHWAAPPWEGRMIGFPDTAATLFDIERGNDQIQQVLLGTRPYGATPIDGMMDDARDYLTDVKLGPWSASQASGQDFYVQGGCRDQYIILLTDGAPNLDMRPSCVGASAPGCPYPTAATTAANMWANAPGTGGNGKHVDTFVIGFSVNGSGDFAPDDGFPHGFVLAQAALSPSQKPNCKAWYNDGTFGGSGTPGGMNAVCHPGAGAPPPAGSTAAACCELNDIAYAGSGGVAGGSNARGPFFAESQADLSIAFGSVLASVTRSATTRTVPGYSPVVTLTGGTPTTGTFVASFIPNTQKVWSGEIDRTRYTCSGALGESVPATQTIAAGDSYAYDTALAATQGKRLFITAKAPQILVGGKTTIDSAGVIRPYLSGSDGLKRADGSTASPATEVGGADMAVINTASDWPLALGIDTTTCKASRTVDPVTHLTTTVPALNGATGADDCSKVVWGFTTATAQNLTYSGYNFNIRCRGGLGGSASAGKCSVSGNSCDVGTPCGTGEVCVPSCSALGAVYRSSPTIVGPPTTFSSDDGLRGYQQDRNQRRSALFVSTADGILHAFKALPDDPAVTTADNYELWAFVPPAILPRLASNYPGGSQILLDGTPAVKDTVWDRNPSLVKTPPQAEWHTTLVAGLGVNGGGYYALNVTDVDCNKLSTGRTGGCLDAANLYTAATSSATAGTSGAIAGAGSAGPHFLWQLTDFQAQSGEVAKTSRSALTQPMVSVFGKQSATPAITTLNVDLGGGEHQVGVAILPGGIDGPPSLSGSCQRAVFGGYGGFSSSSDLSAVTPATYPARTNVRLWGAPDCNAGVAGRGVTIVRLDTGEILAHFGRKSSNDVPTSLKAKTIDSPFDSPIIGTPIVYPAGTDASAEKIFVGDADGTVWRIDVAGKTTSTWKVELFLDTAGTNAAIGGGGPASGQPIQLPMTVSTSPTGNLVLAVATGDQENIVASSSLNNWLYSIEEIRPTAGGRGRPDVKWVKLFTGAERVTGPMVVFDRSLYFASYKPEPATSGSGACGGNSRTSVWGMDYLTNDGSATGGGAGRWCSESIKVPANVTSAGACTSGLVQKEDVGGFSDATTHESIPVGSIIPGVSVRQTQSCATYATNGDGTSSYTALQPVQYQLSFGVTATRTSSSGGLSSGQAGRLTPRLPTPRINTSIDAWAIVID